MSMPSGSTADYLVDRRRLRRKVTFWRIAAILVAVCAIVGVAVEGRTRLANDLTPHIARVKIGGLITGDEETLRLLRQVGSSRAAALILQIESPGGTTVGSERVYDEIRKVAAKKPVVAEVDTVAASGAYIAALGADHIVAYGNSLVGSIGVLFQYPNVSGLLDKIGVKVEEVKSAPLKAAPNGLEPTSEAARAALASLVSDSFTWFKALVKDRRGMSDDELAAVDDGRVFTGRQALPLKLIDQIGTEQDAIAWLETSRSVAKGLPVRDYKPEHRRGLFGLFSIASTAEALGLTSLADIARKVDASAGAVRVDGLMAVWQGARGE
ncbi:MAG TPA: signal peptide peptidase SppA [Lichenihabitans sp.]|jgi:protease-4|nr:signal peptide peptidase SppA [Lichenihabitans sp.]